MELEAIAGFALVRHGTLRFGGRRHFEVLEVGEIERAEFGRGGGVDLDVARVEILERVVEVVDVGGRGLVLGRWKWRVAAVKFFAFGGFGVAFIGGANGGRAGPGAEIVGGGHFAGFVKFVRELGEGFDVLFEELLLLLLVELVLTGGSDCSLLLLVVVGLLLYGEVVGGGVIVVEMLCGEGRTSGGVARGFVFGDLLDLLDGFDDGVADHAGTEKGFVLGSRYVAVIRLGGLLGAAAGVVFVPMVMMVVVVSVVSDFVAGGLVEVVLVHVLCDVRIFDDVEVFPNVGRVVVVPFVV